MNSSFRESWLEASARERIKKVVDLDSFCEWLPPDISTPSPHLEQLEFPGAFDDGVVIGQARVDNFTVFFAAQEGQFIGGAVGEIHGAKIVGMLQRALIEKPKAVLLLVDSGGVRLHEANAGLIAISEIMRALADVRSQGIPVIALLGGICGAFGGMSIVTKMCSEIIMSEEGRLSLSGPEVIETVKGVEEFDSKNRALVWQVTGGKHRFAMNDCSKLVEDHIPAFRHALIEILTKATISYSIDPLSLSDLRQENQRLQSRINPNNQENIQTEFIHSILHKLFANDYQVKIEQKLLVGNAKLQSVKFIEAKNNQDTKLINTSDNPNIKLLGTTHAAEIDHFLALNLAQEVLDTVEQFPKQPFLLFIDTVGQILSRQEESGCLSGSFAHLALCLDLARRQGHPIIALITQNAVSGGFLCFGLMADEVYALPDSQVRVMDLKAMARVTKIPYEKLQELASNSPIFAPGAINYQRMGAIDDIWPEPSNELISQAFQVLIDKRKNSNQTSDGRSKRGLARQGRSLAQPIVDKIISR